MTSPTFRERLWAGGPLTGTFVKTPSHQVIELLAAGGAVDVAVIDTEHAPFDPAQLDAMLAVAHVLELPCLVRVAAPAPALVQAALDGGATGVVVPHVASSTLAADAVRWSHYGDRGRGYSGSTRSAGWGTRPIQEVLARAAAGTTVVVQVEDVAAVDVVDEIVAVDGIDAVLIGTADLTVGLGCTETTHPWVTDAVERIVAAARSANRPLACVASDAAETARWHERGAALVVESTDQARLRTR